MNFSENFGFQPGKIFIIFTYQILLYSNWEEQLNDIYETDARKDCSSNGCVECSSYLIYEFPKGTILIIEIVKGALTVMEEHEFP